jgi:hypothetical protein
MSRLISLSTCLSSKLTINHGVMLHVMSHALPVQSISLIFMLKLQIIKSKIKKASK